MERDRRNERYHPYAMPQRSDQLSSGDTTAEGRKCSICLDSEAFTDFHTLPCAHKFHAVCLIQWLRRSFCCPICRLNLNQNLSEADESDQLGDGEGVAEDGESNIADSDEEFFEESLFYLRNGERLESDGGQLNSDSDEEGDTILNEQEESDGESDNHEWRFSSDSEDDGDIILNEELFEGLDEEFYSDERQLNSDTDEDGDTIMNEESSEELDEDRRDD